MLLQLNGYFLGGACICLWRGVRIRLGIVAATFSVLALLIMKFPDSCYARPESFVIEYVALAFGLLLIRVNFITCAIIGIGMTFAFFMKQSLICPFVGMFIFLALSQQGRVRMQALSGFVSAAFLSTAIIVVWMIGSGILGGYWRDCFMFNFLYQNKNPIFIDGFSIGALVKSIYRTIKNIAPFIGLACAGLVAMLIDKTFLNQRMKWSLLCSWLVWIVMDIFLVSRCGRHFDYYYFPIKLACILAALPLVGLCEKYFFDEDYCKMRCNLLGICALMPLLFPIFLEEASRLMFYLQNKLVDAERINFVLRTVAQQKNDSKLFVWGNNTELFIKSNRRSISPYYYWTPFHVDGFLSDDEIETFMNKLVQDPVIIVEKVGVNSEVGDGVFEDGYVYGDSKFKLALRKVVSEYYEAVTEEGGPLIYIHK